MIFADSVRFRLPLERLEVPVDAGEKAGLAARRGLVARFAQVTQGVPKVARPPVGRTERVKITRRLPILRRERLQKFLNRLTILFLVRQNPADLKMRQAVIGPVLGGLLEFGQSVVELSLHLEKRAQVVVRLGIIGINLDRLATSLLGPGKLPQVE